MKTKKTASIPPEQTALAASKGDINICGANETKNRSPEEILILNYNEPAVLVDPKNEILHANPKAHRIKHLFKGEVDGELARLGTTANETNSVIMATVSLATFAGQAVYQVSVVPHVMGNQILYLFHDQTLDHNLRDALIESRQRYKDLVEVSSDFSWEVGADGCFQFVSRTGALGYISDDFIGKKPEDFMVGADEFDCIPFHTKDVVENVELWMYTAEGTMACVQVSAKPFCEENGEPLGVRGVCRDVTHDREREAALSQAHQREQVLSYIVSTIREEINPVDMLDAAVAATARAMGATGCAVLRKDDTNKINEESSTPSPHYIRAAEFGTGGPKQFGDDFLRFNAGDRMLREANIDDWHVIAGPCQHAGEINGVICLWRQDDWSDDARLMVSDIAGQLGIAIEQITNHESIVHLSRTDSMTGLLNRRAFYEEELPRRFKRLALDDSSGALFFVDMDNFKLVNDVHGHQTGDEAILALRDVLYDFVRPGDLIARLGGDEFALWLDGVSESVTVSRCKDLIKAAKSLEKYSGSPTKPLGISVGIAVYQHASGETLDHLIARADEAMYAVKHETKGGFKLADPILVDSVKIPSE